MTLRLGGALAGGFGVAGLVLLVAGAALAGLFTAAGAPRLAVFNEPYVRAALLFTLKQAALSTLLSLMIGAPLALALARRRFRGRRLLLDIMGASFVLPVIVAVFGIVAVYGRRGWLNSTLHALGVETTIPLYGLGGILIAHVFFNAPLAARIYLAALERTPAQYWRLSASLGFRPLDAFRIIDLPVLARETPAIAGLVFLLCATSFTAVLALGGGPGAATLEVAIYEALRFDFDLPRAALLSMAQIALALVALLLAQAIPDPAQSRAASQGASERTDRCSAATQALDAITFIVAALLVFAPLAAIVASVFSAALGEVIADPAFAPALWGSLVIAIPAGLAATTGAALLAAGALRLERDFAAPRGGAALTLAGSLVLAAPPFALATGLFVLLRPLADPAMLAKPLVALVNALIALPFALRLLKPALRDSAEKHDRLARSLGIAGFTRLRLIDWPHVRRPVALALATSIAFSLGDVGVAALFGTGDALTLPVLLYAYLGSYQMDKAAGAMVLLALLLGLLFLGADRLIGGRRAD